MRLMEGNPHYEPNCTVNSFYELEGAYHHNETLLAIAFEQRTANLIALASLPTDTMDSFRDGRPDFDGLMEQIAERLGLDK